MFNKLPTSDEMEKFPPDPLAPAHLCEVYRSLDRLYKSTLDARLCCVGLLRLFSRFFGEGARAVKAGKGIEERAGD